MSEQVICVSSDSDEDISLTNFNAASPRISNEFVPAVEEMTNKAQQASGRRKASRKKEKDAEKRKRDKEQIDRDKRIKALVRQNQKNIKSGECMKFIRVSLDRGIEKFPFHTDIFHVLQSSDVSCKFESLPVPNSITWMRKIEQHYLNSSNEICTKSENKMENQVLVIWNWAETIEKIENGTFVTSIASIASLLPNRQQTLIIYGMEEYFGNLRKLKKTDERKNVQGASQDRDRFEKMPKISRHKLQASLAEIQLMFKFSSRMVETEHELAMLVYQFTKSIAEIPLKLEKMQKTAEKMDWYAMGDNRDTVRVDKDGNGLRRLWQQQLCQFNLASLETAEAISSVYPSPRELMKAYATCNPAEGEILLRDIPIRRAAGPLSTVRKIGPELSKKIFVMFTSKDGDMTLGNDREL